MSASRTRDWELVHPAPPGSGRPWRRMRSGLASPLPRVVKIAHTGVVAALVPVYWRHYGPGNFLWFSDVALFASVPALLFESRRVASTALVAVLVPEALWVLDFSAGLVARTTPLRLASYMFDRRIPRFVRALSLFHLALTPLLAHVVARRGYHPRAMRDATLATAALLLASWRLTKPEENVNWVHARRDAIRSPRARGLFVLALMIGIPLLIQLPSHRLLRRAFPAPSR